MPNFFCRYNESNQKQPSVSAIEGSLWRAHRAFHYQQCLRHEWFLLRHFCQYLWMLKVTQFINILLDDLNVSTIASIRKGNMWHVDCTIWVEKLFRRLCYRLGPKCINWSIIILCTLIICRYSGSRNKNTDEYADRFTWPAYDAKLVNLCSLSKTGSLKQVGRNVWLYLQHKFVKYWRALKMLSKSLNESWKFLFNVLIRKFGYYFSAQYSYKLLWLIFLVEPNYQKLLAFLEVIIRNYTLV